MIDINISQRFFYPGPFACVLFFEDHTKYFILLMDPGEDPLDLSEYINQSKFYMEKDQMQKKCIC